jgi:hypothetical protein
LSFVNSNTFGQIYTDSQPLARGGIEPGFITTVQANAAVEAGRMDGNRMPTDVPLVSRPSRAKKLLEGANSGNLIARSGNIFFRFFTDQNIDTAQPLPGLPALEDYEYPIIEFPYDFNDPSKQGGKGKQTLSTFGILYTDPSTGRQRRCRFELHGMMANGVPYFSMVDPDRSQGYQVNFFYGVPIIRLTDEDVPVPRPTGGGGAGAGPPGGGGMDTDEEELQAFLAEPLEFGRRRKVLDPRKAMKLLNREIKYLLKC